MGVVSCNGKETGGDHVGFLRQVTEKKARCQWGGTWRKAAAESVLKESGTQKLGTYINKRQETVEEWVVLILMYKVWDKETV